MNYKSIPDFVKTTNGQAYAQMKKIFKNKIIIIAGPTASGKTAMGVKLAKKINGEIINADSRSIYRDMNIGTGKPTQKEMSGIPHHLFDIKNPDETFSVAEFKKLASKKIEEIQNKGKIPIIVGGTGLYIDALVYDFDLTERETDESLRRKLEKVNTETLFEELKKVDPVTTVDPKNNRRVIRAIEIYHQTGKSKTSQDKRKPLPKNVSYFAIDIPREELYKRINERVGAWTKESFEKEVGSLLEKYSLDDPGMSGIGYKQYGLYLTGKISKEEAIEKFKQGDRNLAKRQMTWFRRNKDITWIKNIEDIEKARD